MKKLIHFSCIVISSLFFCAISQADTITYMHTDALGSPVAATDESGNILWREHYSPFGAKLDNSDKSKGNDVGYTGHQFDNDTGLVYMQARYYDPVIGRFYSNDPVGYVGKNPIHSFGRYTYVNNNPYKYVDPDGKYGRGKGWTDKQWKKFNRAQKRLSGKMSRASKTLKSKAAGMADGDTTSEGYSASDLISMAGSLDSGVTALNDTGTGGHFANAASMLGQKAGEGVIGGKTITMNTSHANFGDNQNTALVIGHEALHNAGLTHPKFMGNTPYKFGSYGQRMSYKNLPPHKQVSNPDHVMSQVYP
ncbi:MAG: RHS domain-containing protein [Psychrobium sp.]|nr:RHS domain-containing protein [Psychrobium sp.]